MVLTETEKGMNMISKTRELKIDELATDELQAVSGGNATDGAVVFMGGLGTLALGSVAEAVSKALEPYRK